MVQDPLQSNSSLYFLINNQPDATGVLFRCVTIINLMMDHSIGFGDVSGIA